MGTAWFWRIIILNGFYSQRFFKTFGNKNFGMITLGIKIPRVIIPKFLSPPLAWKTVVGYWDCTFISVWECMCRGVCVWLGFTLFESPLKNWKSDCNQTWVKDAIGVPSWKRHLSLTSDKIIWIYQVQNGYSKKWRFFWNFVLKGEFTI